MNAGRPTTSASLCGPGVVDDVGVGNRLDHPNPERRAACSAAAWTCWLSVGINFLPRGIEAALLEQGPAPPILGHGSNLPLSVSRSGVPAGAAAAIPPSEGMPRTYCPLKIGPSPFFRREDFQELILSGRQNLRAARD